LLPPAIEEIWISPGRGELSGGVSKGIQLMEGTNLGKNRPQWDQLVTTFDWPATCRGVFEDALLTVAARPELSERVNRALSRQKAESMTTLTQAMARTQALGEVIDRDELQRRSQLVESCIVNPTLKLDSCGVILLVPSEL
jgi:hypothetical protein